MKTREIFKIALKNTSPIILVYLILGAAWAIAFSTLVSQTWFLPPLMALVVYAGSAQFIATDMLATGTSLFQIGMVTVVVNGRHFFYGMSMLERYQSIGRFRWYLILTLTDECYTILKSTQTPDSQKDDQYVFFVSLIHHLSWTLGCLGGALVGSQLTLDTRGIEFLFPALFCVAALEQYRKIRIARPFIIAALISFACLATVGGAHMLLLSMALSTLYLLLFFQAKGGTKR